MIKRITLRISEKKHSELKAYCALKHVSMSNFIDWAIAEKIKRERKNNGISSLERIK